MSAEQQLLEVVLCCRSGDERRTDTAAQRAGATLQHAPALNSLWKSKSQEMWDN